jgi:murein DD-endopeptidase MepM/ murein hydrolase activator NlpD
MLRIAFVILALGALSACGNMGPAVPRLSNPPTAVQSKPAQPRAVRVEGADTLFSLSKRYGVSPRDIIDANNLQPPYRLTVGQSLLLPAPRTHVVARGETLNAIARQHGVDTHELARVNMLLPPYVIRPNQTLTIPGGSGGDVVPSAVEVADRGAAPPAPAPRSVQRADTVEIAAPSVPPTAVREPEPRAPREEPTPPSPAAREEPPAPPQTQLASLPKPAGRARGASRFVWPVNGQLASEYGSKGEGLQNDGINIAAPKGTPVKAAASGVVAYAGNEIRGFGNLLLIRHADGWMTAYAHNDKLLVQRGDTVEQGQPIAHVGQTGNVVSPQLHFEIRRGKRAVDPLDQLGSQRSS